MEEILKAIAIAVAYIGALGLGLALAGFMILMVGEIGNDETGDDA